MLFIFICHIFDSCFDICVGIEGILNGIMYIHFMAGFFFFFFGEGWYLLLLRKYKNDLREKLVLVICDPS